MAFPLQLFYNIYHIDYEQEIPLKMLVFISLVIILMTIILVLVVPRTVKDRTKWGSFIQGAFRSNFLLIGLPLANNLFGDKGVVVASIALPVVVPLYNFLAVLVLSLYSNEGEVGKKINYLRVGMDILKNPLIIASVLGVLLAGIHFPIFMALDRGIHDVGMIATPLALILLGGQFRMEDLHGRLKLAVIASLLRVLFLPLLIITAAVLLGFRGEDLGTILIVFSTPSAISGYIMAKNMKNDAELSGQIIVLTTLLSAFTIFVWVSILRYAGMF